MTLAMVKMAADQQHRHHRQPDAADHLQHVLELPHPVAVVVHHTHLRSAAQRLQPALEGARVDDAAGVEGHLQRGGQRLLAPAVDEVGDAREVALEALPRLRRA